MTIEISDASQQLLAELIASGRYRSVDEVIAAAANAPILLKPMPSHVEVDELAAQQGVHPIGDFRDLRADFWPNGETAASFLNSTTNEPDSPRVL